MKQTLKAIFVLVSLQFVFGCDSSQEETQVQAPARKTNILLIVADDMGFSDIGAFGGEVMTPTLDKLADEGLRLTNFHVLPTCSPSRSVLLSGMDNHLAGIGTMGEVKTPEMEAYPGYAGYLNFEVAALPEILKAGGYHTYMSGKWHLGDEPATRPHARGFEETFALVPGGGSHWSDRRPLSPPQTMIYARNGETLESLPEDFYSTRYYTDQMLAFIKDDQDDDSPFFAYLSYTSPHDPLHAPKEYIDKYHGKYDSGWDDLRLQRLQALKDLGIVPPGAEAFPRIETVSAWSDMPIEERENAARDMEVYAAMIDYMDGQILRVFDYLKEIGEYDNTLILFFSDNGANGAVRMAYPGQTEEFLNTFDNRLDNRGLLNSYVEMGPGWAQASMAPGRMFKGFTSEGGIRSPLIVKLPGKMTNAGAMASDFVHVRDIMPSILDIAGVSHTTEFEGREVRPLQGQSVLGFFAGDEGAPYAGASQVGYELFGLKAYIDGDWKILLMPPPFASGEWELYKLSEDPGELNDLSSEYPERVADMVAKWEQYKNDNIVLDSSLDLSRMIE